VTVGVNVVKANGLALVTGWKTETGAAATSAKINDDDVNTYLRSDSTASPRSLFVLQDAPTLAADEVILAVRFRARVTQPNTGKTGFAVGWYNPGNATSSFGVPTIYNGGAGNAWVYGPWTRNTPDGNPWSLLYLGLLAVKVTDYKKNAVDTSYFKEVWADVLVGTKPTATVTLPTEGGTETVTNSPTLSVTAVDADDSTSTVTTKVLTSNVATLTLSAAHAFAIGEQITVSGVDATFDGTWTVTAATSNTVSYDCYAANVGSTADTGTVTSNRSRAIFGADFRVFTAAQYGIGGFDPATSPCTFESLWDSSSLDTVGDSPVDAMAVPTPLPNGTYRVYARVWAYSKYGTPGYISSVDYAEAQASDWDFNQFTISIVPPETPVVTSSFDATNNKVDVTVNGRVNLLSEQDASLEATGVGTWVADTNASSIARSTTDFSKGSAASLTFTATGAGDSAVRTGNYPVVPSTGYRAVVDIKTPSATRSVRVDIAWYQADGTTLISTSTGTATTTAGTAAYEQRTIDATSPANAAFARIRAYVVGAAAGNVFRIDGIGIWPEQSGSWSPGGSTPTGILLERSDDGGFTWATVVGGSALDGAAAQAVAFSDYSAPRGVTVRYRATQNALTAAGVPVASNISASVTAVVTNDGKWWLKAHTLPSINRGGVRVLASPDYARLKEQSVDRPLGRTDGLAVVTTTTVGGMDAGLKIAATGEAEWAGVEALLKHNGPILIQDPWGRQRWIALTGYSWTENGGVAGTSRTASVGSIEVNEPA
jgi:hypothetical protein